MGCGADPNSIPEDLQKHNFEILNHAKKIQLKKITHSDINNNNNHILGLF